MDCLHSATDPAWLAVALSDFDAVLADHAHCEKKAAASALSLVNSYPDHNLLVRRCIALAQEELRHFRQVHQIMLRRGLVLQRDTGDPYAKALLGTMRHGAVERLIDRLLVNALIEARSCERLGLLAAGLEDAELAGFYGALATAEAGHHRLFVDLAAKYSDPQSVATRLAELSAHEASIMASLPILPRIH